jgi:hypothetical protein
MNPIACICLHRPRWPEGGLAERWPDRRPAARSRICRLPVKLPLSSYRHRRGSATVSGGPRTRVRRVGTTSDVTAHHD